MHTFKCVAFRFELRRSLAGRVIGGTFGVRECVCVREKIDGKCDSCRCATVHADMIY